MNGLIKTGIVLAGYATALLAACAAVAVRLNHTQGPDAQASSGMYAFGDSILFMFVFGVVALFPTGLALYFLRLFRPFWTAISIISLALAVTGIAAASVIAFASSWPLHEPRWVIAEFLAVLLMFAAPLLAAAFILSAFIAPTQRSRWALLGAAAIEGMVSTYAFFHWFGSVFF
jgi:hypothetical protein